MYAQLSDLTKSPSEGAFAKTLNSLPEERKLAIRKALEEAPGKTVELHPEMREQIEAIRKDATGNAGTTVALGLVPYSLEAPALNLWPVVTKFRNAIPRKVIGGTGHHWKRLTAIDTAGGYGFVAEPTDTTANTNAGRAGFNKTTEVDDSVVFATLGLDDYVTFAARYGSNTTVNSGMNFRADEVARLATLQATMMREEKAIIGANKTALANTGMTPTTTGVTKLASTAGSLSTGTAYQIQITALTLLGVRAGSTGHASADSVGETSAATQTALTTESSSDGSTSLSFTWPWKAGAVAYNVYAVATSGTSKYMATVYTNFYALTTITPTGSSTNVPNTLDTTADASGYDGLISLFAAKAGYVAQLGGATKATWTSTPASTGAITIDQVDTACLSLFNTYNTGPTRAFISATDKKKITAAVTSSTIASGTTPYLHFEAKGGDGGFKGGIGVGALYNQYMGNEIGLEVHPYIPQGTMILWCDNLGEYYPNVRIPNPVEMLLAYEYMNVEWARTALREEFGVYVCGAPAIRAGFPLGIIQGAY